MSLPLQILREKGPLLEKTEPKRKGFRAKPGDIIEIETPQGLAYAQFTHRHDEYGQLIGVFPGFHDQRPDDFAEIVRGEEQFMTFVALDACIKDGLLAIAGHEEVPETKRTFPCFRSSNDERTKEVSKHWWLWDGEQSWYVGELTEEQRHLPIKGIANPAAIVIRLMNGWKAEWFG